MGKLALEMGIEDTFEQRCRAHRRQVNFGGDSMRRRGANTDLL